MWSTTLKSKLAHKRPHTSADDDATFLSQAFKRSVLFLLLASSHLCTAEIFFSSRTIGPSTNIYSVDAEGVLKKITDNSAWQDTEAYLSENGEIVFMSNRKDEIKVDLHKNSEDFNIFKLALNSGQIQQISFAPELEHSPVISADGHWIAYIQKTGEFRKLMLLKNGEKTPRTLTIADDIRGFSWSPNNRILSVASLNGTSSRLFLFDVITNEKLNLLDVPTRKIASNENTLSIGKFNPLLSDEHTQDGNIIASAQWSPDGRKIAYILASSETLSRKLYVLDLWSNENILVSKSDVQVQHPVSWSPNSKNVLYSALVNFKFYFDEEIYKKVYEGSMQVYLADLLGDIEQLTEGEYLHNHPVFSPDGEQIAFLYGDNLGARTLALHTLSLKNKEQREYYDRVAGDSYLFWR